MALVRLRDICHARSGDKGDTVNIGVICYDARDYPWLAKHLACETVLRHFGSWVHGPAERYELPRIGALNFLVHGALDGGVTKALIIDGHGKGYSTILLELVIDTDDVPASLQAGAAA